MSYATALDVINSPYTIRQYPSPHRNPELHNAAHAKTFISTSQTKLITNDFRIEVRFRVQAFGKPSGTCVHVERSKSLSFLIQLSIASRKSCCKFIIENFELIWIFPSLPLQVRKVKINKLKAFSKASTNRMWRETRSRFSLLSLFSLMLGENCVKTLLSPSHTLGCRSRD